MDEPAALGLDLGTTFSVVAQVEQSGAPVVLPNTEGSPTTPSIVLFDGDHAIVGETARQALATDPELVVQLVKRHMGSQWVFDYRGIAYGPEHVSSLIVRKMHQSARQLADVSNQMVITVPAYFDDQMRLATRRAGELAGVEVLGLLSEPTAAALAFGYQHRPTGVTGAVIDLGGGTFDITVMDYTDGDVVVRAAGGDAYLGGANFDKALFDYFVEQFCDAHGLDINEPDALSIDEFTQVSRDWLARANRAKHDLTARQHATVALQVAGLTHRLEVPRDVFLSLTRVLLDEMTEKMIDVVAAAGLTPKDVGVVLVVGGATRIPAVRERIQDVFGVPPQPGVRPDEAVALGAALFAAREQLERGGSLQLQPQVREYLENTGVSDVAAHTVGVRVVDATTGSRIVAPVLPKNVTLPLDRTRSFFTRYDNETSIVVPILQGDSTDPGLCRELGAVRVDGLPPGRRANQQVDIRMHLDRDGILTVRATDVASGRDASTTIVPHDSDRDRVAAAAAADRAVQALIVE